MSQNFKEKKMFVKHTTVLTVKLLTTVKTSYNNILFLFQKYKPSKLVSLKKSHTCTFIRTYDRTSVSTMYCTSRYIYTRIRLLQYDTHMHPVPSFLFVVLFPHVFHSHCISCFAVSDRDDFAVPSRVWTQPRNQSLYNKGT